MFHLYLRCVMAQEKETCALVLVGCFWLFNLENNDKDKPNIAKECNSYTCIKSIALLRSLDLGSSTCQSSDHSDIL